MILNIIPKLIQSHDQISIKAQLYLANRNKLIKIKKKEEEEEEERLSY